MGKPRARAAAVSDAGTVRLMSLESRTYPTLGLELEAGAIIELDADPFIAGLHPLDADGRVIEPKPTAELDDEAEADAVDAAAEDVADAEAEQTGDNAGDEAGESGSTESSGEGA